MPALPLSRYSRAARVPQPRSGGSTCTGGGVVIGSRQPQHQDGPVPNQTLNITLPRQLFHAVLQCVRVAPCLCAFGRGLVPPPT